MIISHKFRYVFVELPHTGTTAISNELRELYAGERILHKHAHYWEFAGAATADEREYFVFGCIRNPLDEAVSIYLRYQSNHKGAYSAPNLDVAPADQPGVGRHRWVKPADVETFDWIRRTEADFPTFFRREYTRVYDNWSSEAHDKFDFVIRFENLQSDFANVLGRLRIEQIRPLPVVNRTGEKSGGFTTYYTPEIIPRAMRTFGPFMQRWGYAFPSEWGNTPVSRLAQVQFQALGFVRRLYWRFIRPRFRAARS